MVAALAADVSTSRIDTVAIDASRVRVRVASGCSPSTRSRVRAPGTVRRRDRHVRPRRGAQRRAVVPRARRLARRARALPAARSPATSRRVRRSSPSAWRARARTRRAARSATRCASPSASAPAPRAIVGRHAGDDRAGLARRLGVRGGRARAAASRASTRAVAPACRGSSPSATRSSARASPTLARRSARRSSRSPSPASPTRSWRVASRSTASTCARRTASRAATCSSPSSRTRGATYGVRADYGDLPRPPRAAAWAASSCASTRTLWAATHASAVRWGQPGIEVENLELLNGVGGRLFVDGRLPTAGAANLRLQVENFQVADVLGLLQSDVPVRGLARPRRDAHRAAHRAGHPRDRGARQRAVRRHRAPRRARDGRLRDRRSGRAPRRAATCSRPWRPRAARGTRRRCRRHGRVLAIARQRADQPRAAGRHRPAPRRRRADRRRPARRQPAARHRVALHRRGVATCAAPRAARGTVRGTVKAPTIAGDLDARRRGHARRGGGHPPARRERRAPAARRLGRHRLDRRPHRRAHRDQRRRRHRDAREAVVRPARSRPTARACSTTRWGASSADAQISAYGPFDGVFVSGGARVRGGVLYIPESDNKQVISAGDPAVFAVIDTTRLPTTTT